MPRMFIEHPSRLREPVRAYSLHDISRKISPPRAPSVPPKKEGYPILEFHHPNNPAVMWWWIQLVDGEWVGKRQQEWERDQENGRLRIDYAD